MKNGRIILKATLTNLSPVGIGSGRDDFSDRDIVTTLYKIDQEGQILSPDNILSNSLAKELPFIPATSFLGKLNTLLDTKDSKVLKIWGVSNEKGDNGNASYIDCSDILITELPKWAKENNCKVTEVRDGIRIDSRKGVVINGAKFDYELLGSGVNFGLTMIFRVESEKEKDDKIIGGGEIIHTEYQTVLDLASSIAHIIENGFDMGAKSNVGFGRMEGNAELFELNFENKEDFARWIEDDLEHNIIKASTPKYVKEQAPIFQIDAKFKIKNSLIIRSYSNDPKRPDSTHLKSGGENILSGPSIKGALSSRAERILNTLLHNQEDRVGVILTALFGDVEKEKDDRQKVKRNGYKVPSRVFVDEVVIEDTKEELQTRIQIDRFTGGTVDGALIEEVPLFPKTEEGVQIKNFKLRVKDATPLDKGLILLLLKDLWTSDLPIGGEKSIGRGVLEGVSAIVSDGEDVYNFPDDFKCKNKTDKLQEYVNSLTVPDSYNYYENRVKKYIKCK